ncbi:popeye domain-containing protein 3-like isoform X1 [Penaeus japonicus]|uniref:popeye domain-containing protein 3-like isoform X1 n=1 Tax=Penaeus japonicus TaxID=27405 RepID=UPI001C70DD5A|nr:popeye domain-containing protein 3-like isoform X1 [Penaeus japonicus]
MGNNETVMGPIVTTVATLLYNLTDDDPSAAAVAGAVGLNLSASGNATTTTTRAAAAATTRPTRATTAALTSAAATAAAPFFTTDAPAAYDIRDIIRLGGVDYGEFGVCSDWLPINHIYFQLANIFLFLSYLAPNGIYGILYLRITLTIGCMFFALWGWVILCAFDTFLWNAIFVLINLVHVVVICYYLRPVRFTPELEQVYRSLFQPLKVSRHQFKRVINCMKLIRYVKFQEIYAQEKITRVDSLSLVLSGRLVISQNGRALHIVSQHQFLDSPEWFGVSTDEFFQVSATAIEDSRVLIWHRDKLKLTIMGDQFLQAVFDHILGRDVVKKLMQIAEFRRVNESLSGMSNGHCVANLADDSETKPLLVVKKGEESGSITAIINRQLQGGDEDEDSLLEHQLEVAVVEYRGETQIDS